MDFKGHYDFLSNFYVTPGQIVNFAGYEWNCVEAPYQASKSMRFDLFQGLSPAKAKKLGRKLPILNPDWETKKVQVMVTLVSQKFCLDTTLGRKLAVIDGPIVESNYWHDNFWGSCTCAKCGDKGANYLGHILMYLRDHLKGIYK